MNGVRRTLPNRLVPIAASVVIAVGCTSNRTQHAFGEWQVTQSFRSGISIERRLAPATRMKGIVTHYTGIRRAEYRVHNDGPHAHCVKLAFTNVEDGRAKAGILAGYTLVASGETVSGGLVETGSDGTENPSWETNIRVRPAKADGGC